MVDQKERSTAWLLEALLAIEKPSDIPPAELIERLCPPGGGGAIGVSMVGAEDLPEPGFHPVPIDPTGSSNASGEVDDLVELDEVAYVAAGPPHELALAVAEHLVAIGEDEFDRADSRSAAIHALRYLLDDLSSEECAAFVPRLVALAERRALSPIDRVELGFRGDFREPDEQSEARRFGANFLVAASEAFQKSMRGRGMTDDESDVVSRYVAAAVVLMRDEDGDARLRGALTIVAVSRIEGQGSLASTLLAHQDNAVRALGAKYAPMEPALFNEFVHDPSPEVRRALAVRRDVPPEVLEHLRQDPDSAVRLWAASATETPADD